MRKGHTNTRFGLTAYPKKPLINAHSGVSRAKLFGVFFNLHTLFMREAKALVGGHAGSSGPSPHANIIRTIISCADKFIYYSVYNLNS